MKTFTRKGWALLLSAAVVVGLLALGCDVKIEIGSGGGGDGGGGVVVDSNTVVKGTFTDNRDGQTYKTVKIGNQTWMAENLNFETQDGSWCYEGNDYSIRKGDSITAEQGCAKYGRLYDWNTAKTACPIGWHLPTNDEWNALVSAAGGDSAKKLKSQTGWYSNVGEDMYGFSALPGGFRNYSGGTFYHAGDHGYWWTATEDNSGDAYYQGMHSYGGGSGGEDVGGDKIVKSYGLSVRCVK